VNDDDDGFVSFDSLKQNQDDDGFISFPNATEEKKKEVVEQIAQEDSTFQNAIRTVMQVPLGIAGTTTAGLLSGFFQLLATGEMFDQEGIDDFRRAAEKSGIPFDEEAYKQAAQTISDYIPTVQNLSRIVEEKTGIPLEPKTTTQKALRLGTEGARLTSGTNIQKPISGVMAPVTSNILQELGVPEPIADTLGLGTGAWAGSKSPEISIGKKTKPSGLTERRYEKITSPKEVSTVKKEQINTKVEKEFRDIASDLIEKSPIEETYTQLKNDKEFKNQARESFKKVEQLAEDLPETLSTKDLKKNLVDRVIKEKGTGFLPTEFEKNHKKLIKQFIQETPNQDITAKDLVTQYRKNNAGLSEAYEPGQSFAYNRAKREALLDYNKTIADTIEKNFPNSEFSNLFKSSNKQWQQIMDAEAIDKFMDKLFEGKINFTKGHDLFDKNGMVVPFKRALGEKGFKDFEQLTKDLLSTEQANKMLKIADKQGLLDFGKKYWLYLVSPKAGLAKTGFDIVKSTHKKIWESLLDKPQLAVKWEKGIKEFKKGNFEAAEKQFETLKEEISKKS
jgi:hypothetical protein